MKATSKIWGPYQMGSKERKKKEEGGVGGESENRKRDREREREHTPRAKKIDPVPQQEAKPHHVVIQLSL